MKKLSSVIAGIFVLILSIGATAQSKTGAEYFKGTWSVLLKGLPDGDKKLVFVLENRNDSIAGSVQDTVGVEITKITNADLKENEIIIYFSTQGYDVSLLMIRKDDDHTTGNLMNMFDAVGERVKGSK